jgi:hypothetical protein
VFFFFFFHFLTTFLIQVPILLKYVNSPILPGHKIIKVYIKVIK